jgi:hypoxanthine phosphoribosyltransferase
MKWLERLQPLRRRAGELGLKRELILSRETILKRVRELAQQISADYHGEEPILIGVLNGVVFFFVDLVRNLTIPSKIDFIRAASYGSRMSTSGDVRVTKDVEIPIAGKDVIIVEDIVDTGLTLARIVERIETENPRSIRICALIDKSERREVAVNVEYCGFPVGEGFLVGYGLDCDEQYRYLPNIYTLR